MSFVEFENYTIKTPATPEYILNVFKDSHRHACEFDPEVERNIELTFDTTIKNFRLACDLLGWKQLGRAYNEWFNIEFDNAKWKSLLEPASKKILGNLCSEIAKHTYQEKIKPLSIFGKQCCKGGIFLALKYKLAKAGANVDELAPSSELAEYTRLYPHVFLEFSSKVFPNVIPPVKIIPSFWYRLSIVGKLAGCLLALAGFVLGVFYGVLGILIFVFFYILSLCTSKAPPSSMKFGELKTFRDLAAFIANTDAQ
jgi:hypothetical protein